MNAVHGTLSTKAEDESLLPVTWSLYHADRYDVVGQCRQSIETLLASCHFSMLCDIRYYYLGNLWQGHVRVLYWEAFISRWPSLCTTLGDLLLEDIANQD